MKQQTSIYKQLQLNPSGMEAKWRSVTSNHTHYINLNICTLTIGATGSGLWGDTKEGAVPIKGDKEQRCCRNAVCFSCTCMSVPACVLWYLRVSIQLYYPGINFGVDAGMQAVLACKLRPHPSVPVALAVPALIWGRITYRELRVLTIYVAMLLKGHTHTERGDY